jgi:hypothetical protein
MLVEVLLPTDSGCVRFALVVTTEITLAGGQT